jgi:hypothetical protein
VYFHEAHFLPSLDQFVPSSFHGLGRALSDPQRIRLDQFVREVHRSRTSARFSG